MGVSPSGAYLEQIIEAGEEGDTERQNELVEESNEFTSGTTIDSDSSTTSSSSSSTYSTDYGSSSSSDSGSSDSGTSPTSSEPIEITIETTSDETATQAESSSVTTTEGGGTQESAQDTSTTSSSAGGLDVDPELAIAGLAILAIVAYAGGWV